jgi:adenylate cyclase
VDSQGVKAASWHNDTHMSQQGSTPQRGLRLKLQVAIGAALSGMVVLTAFAVLMSMAFVQRQTAISVGLAGTERVAELTELQTQTFLGSTTEVGRLLRRQVSTGKLDLKDREATAEYFLDLLEVNRTLVGVTYGDAEGNFLMVRREPDGAISTKTITTAPVREVRWQHWAVGAPLRQLEKEELLEGDDYDPRTRPWYLGAVRNPHDLFWTAPYVFYSDKTPGVTVSFAHHFDGEVEGAIGFDIALSSLSTFLAELDIRAGGIAALFDGEGRVIASPAAGDVVMTEGGEGPRLRPGTESRRPAIRELAILSDFHAIAADGVKVPQRYAVGGAEWLGVVAPIMVGPENVWLIAVVLPEHELLGPVRRANVRGTLMALAYAGLAFIGSMILGGWITRSLSVLIEETDRIRRMDLGATSRKQSVFSEVNDILEAFDQMRVGLRSFQKYLPGKLVAVLLEAKEETRLGAEIKRVSLLFSDIEGFTVINESMDPMTMAAILGDYLGDLTHVIQEREGTVVEYVGDAIFAMWGAPLDVENMAKKACISALECREHAAGLRGGEEPVLRTRIGLHTAEVAVGHFGAPDRMYYGALGDGVNLCARLESINKHFGTWIIASQTVYEEARDDFEWRRLDRVAVAGKTEPWFLYELLGQKGAVEAVVLDRARRYEAAWEVYQRRGWDEAIAALSELCKEDADNKAAVILRERCEVYRSVPPGPDWDGVASMQHK